MTQMEIEAYRVSRASFFSPHPSFKKILFPLPVLPRAMSIVRSVYIAAPCQISIITLTTEEPLGDASYSQAAISDALKASRIYGYI